MSSLFAPGRKIVAAGLSCLGHPDLFDRPVQEHTIGDRGGCDYYHDGLGETALAVSARLANDLALADREESHPTEGSFGS